MFTCLGQHEDTIVCINYRIRAWWFRSMEAKAFQSVSRHREASANIHLLLIVPQPLTFRLIFYVKRRFLVMKFLITINDLATKLRNWKHAFSTWQVFGIVSCCKE